MPVDRPLAADLAENVVTLYQQAETRLAADLARRLASGMDSPTWAEDKLRGLTTLRRFSENLVSRLDGALGDEIAQSVVLAYVRGGNAALDDLGRAQSTHPEWLRAAGINNPNDRLRAMIERRQAGVAAQLAQARRALPGADAIARLAFSLTTQLRGTHLRIARWPLDSYREVIAAGSAPDVLLGLSTRRRASQIAWEGLLSQGITGFVDRAGRGWNMASYVEMATRSTVAQAAVEGHLDRLSAAGLDLVIVSNAPQECEKCRPWEGKILTRSGPDGKRTVQVEHGTRDGQLVDVDVAGSVDQAVSAGLMHPNCRHSLSAYLPGVTKVPTNTEDPEGDAARQKLRALERKVRGQKLKAETAIDPAAKAGLEAKVRDTQGQIREHVKATGLHRQPTREQIDLGHRPPPGPVASTPLAPPPAPTPPPAPAPAPPAKKATPAKKAAKTTPAPPSKAAKAAPAKKAPPAKAAKKTAPRKTTAPPPQKAAKAAAAREATTTPDVAAAEQHAVRISEGLPGVRIRDELVRQAGVTPRSMQQLDAVHLPEPGTPDGEAYLAMPRGRGSSLAYYTPLGSHPSVYGTSAAGASRRGAAIWLSPDWRGGRCGAAMRQGNDSGWFAPTGATTPLAQTTAHEYGHHVSEVFFEAPSFTGTADMPGAIAQRFLPVLNDALGANRHSSSARNGDLLEPLHWGSANNPHFSVHGDLMDMWVRQNAELIAERVSGYAATNMGELLAEIWQEYSTKGANARPHIKVIGDLMRQIAEELRA